MSIKINSASDAKLFEKQKAQAKNSISSASDASKFYETYGGNGQQGNWGSPNRNVNKPGYYYNKETRMWEKTNYYNSSYQSSNASSNASSISSSQSLSNTGDTSSGGVPQSGVVNPNSSADTDSKTSAEKQYIEIEFNTLTGSCSVIPNKSTIRLRVGETVVVKGIGKYLSGQFFISEIQRTLDCNGAFSLILVLIRNGFGDSLKKIKATLSTGSVDNSKNVVTNSIKIGDKVKIVGDDAIYSNAHEGKKVPDWVKTQTLTVDGLSDDGNRARVQPINSWTYIKFLTHI